MYFRLNKFLIKISHFHNLKIEIVVKNNFKPKLNKKKINQKKNNYQVNSVIKIQQFL